MAIDGRSEMEKFLDCKHSEIVEKLALLWLSGGRNMMRTLFFKEKTLKIEK